MKRKHRWVCTERDEKGREIERTCELCGRVDSKYDLATARDIHLQLSPIFMRYPPEMTCRLDDRLAFEILKAHGKRTAPQPVHGSSSS